MYAGLTITNRTPAFPALCSTIWSVVPHRCSCNFLENLLERARPAMLSFSTKIASCVLTNQCAKRKSALRALSVSLFHARANASCFFFLVLE